MSGSGGYYKYRCMFWLNYNCPNWVWVNNSPCAHCLADGVDEPEWLVEQSVRARPKVAKQEAAAQNNDTHRADGAKSIGEAGLEPAEQNNAAQNKAGLEPVERKNSAIVPFWEGRY
ncbi:hypothetical protein F5882DRAFT_110873 [Hyaloscypha sp. PMI_1271]|nr:hypothetical protein F5882DRAFT_110873 [Hyaloscypha sp. PMI_1271]